MEPVRVAQEGVHLDIMSIGFLLDSEEERMFRPNKRKVNETMPWPSPCCQRPRPQQPRTVAGGCCRGAGCCGSELLPLPLLTTGGAGVGGGVHFSSAPSA